MALLPYASKSRSAFRKVTVDPATGRPGDSILNSSTGEIKVWYGNTWQVLHELVITVRYLLLQDGGKMLQEDGFGILLEG